MRDERRYSPEHLWLVADGGPATLGVTNYIASQIGDPQFYQLPDRGTRISAGEVFAEIEASKTICELTAPVSGTITQVNPRLVDEPALIVDHPYDTWLVQLDDVERADAGGLMSRADYEAYLHGGQVSHPLTRRFAPPE